MNRPGQPQQRAPNLTANPALSSQFRQAYPAYAMPPRNILQAGSAYVPSIQPNTHRTTTQQTQVQTLTSQPSQGFNPPRGQSSYTFGPGVLGQHQPSSVLQQQQQQQPPPPSQQQQQQQQQPPQTNGSQSTLSSLIAQTSGMGATPAVSSAAEVSLDPNDFPALGSTPTNTSSANNNGTGQPTTTSYATQAGTGMLLGGTGAGNAAGSSLTGAQTRDFTPDDFPALGGQAPASQQARDSLQNQLSGQETLSHPPGLNGFPPSEQQQQLRQNMIGTLSTSLQQGTPGMLNLGPTQTRNIHPGFQQGQSEAEKQQQRNNYSLKLNQASHAAWGSPNVNPNTQSQPSGAVAGSNGTFSQNQTTHAPGAIANPTAPPASGPPPFSSNGLSNVDSHPNTSIPNPNGSSNPIPTTSATVNPAPLQTNTTSHLQHPQTPAQQVLISAADRWGLLSLIAMMRNANADADHGLSSIGTDLGTMGLDMEFPGNLYSTFITPWADQSAARTVEPDFHLPACYLSVQAPPPGPAKAVMFSDETLFFMFYSSPRDALQEVAAQELWNRNWRYHKDLRLWITKESGTSPSQKVQGGGGERGSYTYWDPENWVKERKEMMVLYSDLEEKAVPAFLPNAAGLVLQTTGQSQAPGSQQPVQMAAQPQLPSRGPAFQMGMAGL
ncbi:hypothetical protein CVT25_013219 [Psilocybe cyanescens]|uniref:NOT2/NOT3/NOT5 C-terminal domain-containing protein n=1 Tax=Psilocybe cyanescens TaxID=93625 RepID=A0A409X0M7_PSICY|nr:hypothetical protein CVT25_013219 [Psilocybe cyanescens]